MLALDIWGQMILCWCYWVGACLAESLTSPHQMTLALSTLAVMIKKCLQTLLNVPWGTKTTPSQEQMPLWVFKKKKTYINENMISSQ